MSEVTGQASGLRRHVDAMMPVLKRLPSYVRLARAILAGGDAAGVRSRRLLIAGLAYLLSPIDPIPGFVPVIGQLDDLLAALSYTIRVALDAMPAAERERVLAEAGLTRRIVEEDWRTTLEVTRAVLRGTGRAAVRAGGWIAGRLATGALWAGGKMLTGAGRLLSRSRR